MAEHPHYAIVWIADDEDGEESTTVEVYHDAEEARQRWGELDDAGCRTLISSLTEPRPGVTVPD